MLADGPATAFEIAGRLWSQRTVSEQTLLVVWEVLGNLELLLAAGAVAELAGDGGSTFVSATAQRPRQRARRRRDPDCTVRR